MLQELEAEQWAEMKYGEIEPILQGVQT